MFKKCTGAYNVQNMKNMFKDTQARLKIDRGVKYTKYETIF